MGDGWAWGAYLYEEDEVGIIDEDFGLTESKLGDKMDHREADDAIMAKYIKASSTQQEAIDASAQADGMYGATIEPGKVDARAIVDYVRTAKLVGQPHVNVESHNAKHTDYEIFNIPNEQALRIINDILPKALELYLKKSKDYGGNVMSRINLGPKACIPDIQRKFGKLVDAIWFDKPLQYEQPQEILQDLLGHILIILDEMEQAKNGNS